VENALDHLWPGQDTGRGQVEHLERGHGEGGADAGDGDEPADVAQARQAGVDVEGAQQQPAGADVARRGHHVEDEQREGREGMRDDQELVDQRVEQQQRPIAQAADEQEHKVQGEGRVPHRDLGRGVEALGDPIQRIPGQ